jgi:hypothetical protein
MLCLLAYDPAEGVFAWRTFGEEEGPQQRQFSLLSCFYFRFFLIMFLNTFALLFFRVMLAKTDEPKLTLKL